MYKGKFDQKTKKGTSNVHELVSQRGTDRPAAPVSEEQPLTRKTASVSEVPAKKAAPVKEAPVKDTPVKKAAPVKEAPAKKQAAPKEEPVKKQKKGPRLGSVIFYTLYFMFILVFFLATYIGLQWLHGWLSDYELAQPTVKAEQVFTQLFTKPDWGALYESAGAKDSDYEGKEAYVAHMEDKVGDSKLTYMETSAGLSGNKKFVVRLGDEKVASFTLVDKNKVSNSLSLDNLENIADIPDWQLGSVEVFFQREGKYLIQKMDGHTAYVNDVALTDDHTIQIATTKAESYLPEGTTGFSMCTQEVTGLMVQPNVTVFDKNGKQMEVTYDEATRTFTERTESNTMSEEEKEVALEAAKTYCLWMIEEVKDRGTIAKYFDTSSDIYNVIVRTTELWMQNHGGYNFSDEAVTDYARYSDNLFSVKVSLNLNVTRTNGTVKTYEYSQSLFFKRQDTGKWLCFEMTNVDVSQPVGKVRLTFMLGETLLTSSFVSNDIKEIVTPTITVPEGKVFSGWVRQDISDNGDTTLTVVFQPDETDHVSIPAGTVLEPMTLYALFEDASAAAETPAEVPTEAPTEAPAVTEGA